MPRTKPRNVDVIRVELGTKERQLLDDALIGYQVKSIGTPLVALLSDVSAMSLLITSYIVYRHGPEALVYFKNEAYEDLGELYQDAINAAKGLPVIKQTIGVTSFISDLFGIPSDVYQAYQENVGGAGFGGWNKRNSKEERRKKR